MNTQTELSVGPTHQTNKNIITPTNFDSQKLNVRKFLCPT